MSIDTATIQQIIKGCKANQANAQKQLVVSFAPLLLSVARRFCPDRPTAEDVLQESFILVFKNIHQYDAEVVPAEESPSVSRERFCTRRVTCGWMPPRWYLPRACWPSVFPCCAPCLPAVAAPNAWVCTSGRQAWHLRRLPACS